MTAVAIAILLGGLAMLLVSLPLVYRKIPMNHFYGIRIRASFESDQRWYDINAYGGRQMAAWSCLIIATGLVGFFVPREHFLTYAWASVPISLAAVFIPTIQIFRWSRKLGP
ncbi:MAG: SdpI family protein [Opitutaceae bacterium]|nr:SdpI family protein [Opitutaceae bacterium]